MRPLFPAKRLLGRACTGGLAALSRLAGWGPCDGFVVALFLVAIWHQLAASLGGSLATEFSIGWALAIGAVLGLAWRGRRGWLLLGLAGWSAILGLVLGVISWVVAQVPFDQLAAADGLPLALPAATLALSIPVAWSVRLGLLAEGQRLRGFLLGAAVGAVLAAHLLIGWIGVDAMLLLAAAIGGTLFLAELKRGVPGEGLHDSSSAGSRRLNWQSVVGLSVLGAVLASLDRMLVQLLPASEWYLLMSAAGLCLGAAISRPRRSHLLAAGLSATLLLVPALFPWLIEGLLKLKVSGGHPAVLIAAWSILVSMAVMPLGMLLSGLLRGPEPASQEHTAAHTAAHTSRVGLSTAAGPLLVVAGVFLGRFVVIPSAGPVVSAVGFTWCLVVLESWEAWSARPGAGRLALPVAGLVLLSVLSGRYDPQRSARVLFSGRVIAAAEQEWPSRLNESLDESRFVERRETGDATLSVWSQQGARRLLRIDGVPVSAWSQDPAISPRHGSEVLGSVLPLVLHQRPRRVLLLGLGGGEGLRAGLGFPVDRIDCVEPDRGLCELVAAKDVFQDARLRWSHLPAALAVSSASGDYDVVIATATAPVSWRAESTRTLEFYRNAARQLAPGGIFCQALSHRDVGAAAVLVPHATLEAVFELSVQVPVGSGRVLVLATNDPKLINRPGLVARLQGPHVRAALAEIGWDWSNLLQLPVQQPCFDRDTLPLNHVGSGWLAARLPSAALSGGPLLETFEKPPLSPARPLLSFAEIEDEWVAEVRERLADLVKGQKLLGRGAEGIRAYRKAVDKQITSRPRFVFERNSGQRIKRLRHPIDRRRQQFLKVLARVEGLEDPSAAQIEGVVAFAKPFDPLLSEFIHREAASLWSRRSGEDLRRELRHRLHSVYFRARAANGVDDVYEAIESLLRVKPERVESAGDWDHCNAMLELLKQRWSGRSAARLGPKDARATIEVVGRLLDRMDELIQLDSRLGHRWSERREVVDRGLIDPLRLRRSRITRRSGRVLAN